MKNFNQFELSATQSNQVIGGKGKKGKNGKKGKGKPSWGEGMPTCMEEVEIMEEIVDLVEVPEIQIEEGAQVLYASIIEL